MGFSIRTDYRDILNVIEALNSDISEEAKSYIFLRIMYPDYQKIPQEHIEEALRKASEFIDCGMKEEKNRPKPKLVDWDKDAPIICAAINKAAGMEIRAVEYMHWWTFLGHYMGIGESVFSTVVSLRNKLAKHQKLDKHEQEFYRDNKDMVDMKPVRKERTEAEKAYLRKFFGDTV